MITEFRDFLMRGNLLELAVAFVMGLAFATLIGSFVSSFVIPIVNMISGEQDLSGLTFTINDAVFGYGSFIVAVITFVAIASAVFFFIVKPVDAITARTKRPGEEATPDEERRHQELLAAIKEMSR